MVPRALGFDQCRSRYALERQSLGVGDPLRTSRIARTMRDVTHTRTHARASLKSERHRLDACLDRFLHHRIVDGITLARLQRLAASSILQRLRRAVDEVDLATVLRHVAF